MRPLTHRRGARRARSCRAVRTGGILALALAALGMTTAAGAPRSASTVPAPKPAPMAVAPYMSLGWGDPPPPAEVMKATGVRWFTLAFILSKGECEPRWDGERPLTGGVDERTVRAVRQQGGDVIPSFGGGLGHKLEVSCPNAVALARAYQKVIDAYHLKAIDVDIEEAAFKSDAAQRKTIGALAAVRAANPGLVTYVTLPSYRYGPDPGFIDRAAAMGVEPDAWSIMPFSFVPPAKGADMGRISGQAVDGLKGILQNAYGYTDAEAYAHSGISSMNGITGRQETITPADFRTIAAHARRHGLGRITFWSVNRDRPCGIRPYPAEDSCSGVQQQRWQYTRILAQYGR